MSTYEEDELAADRHEKIVAMLEVVASSLRNIERMMFYSHNLTDASAGNAVRRPPKPELWEDE